MIHNVLGFWTPGPFELILLVFLAVPVVLIIVFLQLFFRNKNENIRHRLEVGKLADELEKARKQNSVEESDDVNQ